MCPFLSKFNKKYQVYGINLLTLWHKETDIYEGIGRGIINVTNIPLYCDEVSPFGSPTSDTMRTSVDENCKNILLFVICFSEKYIDECKNQARDLFKRLGNVKEFEEIKVIRGE